MSDLDLARQAKLLQYPDAVVIGIEFVPGQPVPSRYRMRMMVVMPSLTTGQQRNPPAVAGIIPGLKAPGTPQMGCRIDQPCCMQPNGDP